MQAYMDRLKKAFLITYIDTHFTELIRLAIAMKKNGEYEPLFIFPTSYKALERDVKVCEREGIPALDKNGSLIHILDKDSKYPANVTERNIPPSQNSIKIFELCKLVIRSVCKPVYNIFQLFFQILSKYRYHRKYIVTFKSTLSRLKPDIIILSEDNLWYTTPEWIKAAHEMKIPSMILPYTIVNAKEPAEAVYNNKYHHVSWLPNKVLTFFSPKWSYTHKGRLLTRMPAYEAIAIKLAGLSPELPWIINSGATDAIAVENIAMFEYYRKEGLKPEKLVITGALYDDIIAANVKDATEHKKKLCKDLGLDDKKSIILCALPPDQLFPGCINNTEFGSYEELVNFWADALSSINGYNVIVRLHPRAIYDEMRHIERDGLKISNEDTASLIPVCDIYVASVSATIRWAIACGKPVVNYDVYQYRYDDYNSEPGVITISDKKSFVESLNKLAHDSQYYKSISECQSLKSSRWGNFDGRSTERVMKLIDKLVMKYRGV